MPALLKLSQFIDGLNTRIGRWMSWLILLAVIISTVNALIRKVFDQSSNAWLEMQWVLFGAVFLLCAPWTFLCNEHIRIDIVNSLFSKKTRNWIDVFGHVVFLLPFTIVMIIVSVPFFLRSLRDQRTVAQCRRAAAVAVEDADPARFHPSVLSGHLGTDQADRHHPGQTRGHQSGGGHHAAAEAEAARLLGLERPPISAR